MTKKSQIKPSLSEFDQSASEEEPRFTESKSEIEVHVRFNFSMLFYYFVIPN
jgi:hypothetical protein